MHRLFLIQFLFGTIAFSAWGEGGKKGLDSFLETHCYECHDDLTAEGGVNLYDLDPGLSDPASLTGWFDVLDQIDSGAMPPEEEPRPNEVDRLAAVAYLQERIAATERQLHAERGRSETRRLSQSEHNNALRDLLHLPGLTAGDKLPPDELSDGFGKSSTALPVSHILIARYLERLVLGDRAADPAAGGVTLATLAEHGYLRG